MSLPHTKDLWICPAEKTPAYIMDFNKTLQLKRILFLSATYNIFRKKKKIILLFQMSYKTCRKDIWGLFIDRIRSFYTEQFHYIFENQYKKCFVSSALHYGCGSCVIEQRVLLVEENRVTHFLYILLINIDVHATIVKKYKRNFNLKFKKIWRKPHGFLYLKNN